jgi:hypothetical protein
MRIIRETFFRNAEIRRESRMLAAETYNLAKILYRGSRPDALFVPIRAMLYLAVVDDEEIVFLDGAVSHSRIEIAWQSFRPQERTGLEGAVPYEVVFYTRESLTTAQRLQREFQLALLHLRKKLEPAHSPAPVVPLRR